MFSLVALLFLYISFVTSELTVDQYNTLINDFVAKTQNYSYPTSYRDFLKGTYDLSRCEQGDVYDFIIVGGGSAGSVLANRLSEIEKWRILLLEAGGEENDFSDIPAMIDYLRLSEFNWGYKTVPQKNSLLGFVDQVDIIPRGRVLGGTSVINAMMYARGNKQDYDKWGMFNPGWSYNDVLPYFIKSENSTVTPQDYSYHGHKGELNTQTSKTLSPIAKALLSAAEILGYSILDYNGRKQNGFSPIQFTANKGRRQSGAKSFVRPARKRSNLKILTDSFVVQLLIKQNTAYGVKYIKEEKVYCSSAKKEVILSAGVINSPQLLMLSGIGPKEHLISLDINLVQDLPVGQNMWDHIVFPLLPFTTNFSFPEYSQRELIEQYLSGYGAYTLPDSIEAIGFESVYWLDPTLPDIEHILRAAKISDLSWEKYKQLKNLGADIYNDILKKVTGRTVWQSYTMLLHPKSRGTVTLKSKDPFDYPLIDPNYFSDPGGYDLNTLAASVKQMLQLSDTYPMQKFKSQPLEIDLPNCPSSGFGTDGYNRCLVKHLANTIHHFSGTCKMGYRDGSSVVGNDLIVHGIKRLRVADCSVIPVTISGHTNAIAFMIGEKAADLIKKTWGS